MHFNPCKSWDPNLTFVKVAPGAGHVLAITDTGCLYLPLLALFLFCFDQRLCTLGESVTLANWDTGKSQKMYILSERFHLYFRTIASYSQLLR